MTPDMTLGLEHAFDLVVELTAPHEMGKSPAGTRRIIPIVGGTAEGPLLRGRVLNVGAGLPISMRAMRSKRMTAR